MAISSRPNVSIHFVRNTKPQRVETMIQLVLNIFLDKIINMFFNCFGYDFVNETIKRSNKLLLRN